MSLPPARGAAAALAAALLASSLIPAAAHAATPAPSAHIARHGDAGAASGTPAEVTLITGDKVTVAQGPDGKLLLTDIARAPGARGAIRVVVERGDTFVYPDAAVPYLAAGRLDKQLFNISRLLEQDYDDAHTATLPLIVTRSSGSPDERSGSAQGPRPDAALPGTTKRRDLPAVRGEAVEARRSKASALWTALTGADRPHRAGKRTAAGAGDRSEAAFADGVDQVWLDGTARADLAESTAQIGVPTARGAGGTGAGVRVAVLDTGVDTTHPDLAGRVVAARSFVKGEDVTDRNGHGTHTASTIAGTGAASAGKEAGVAPAADLVVGKVLDSHGDGRFSDVLAGMEWAVRTERARIVNMSLGTSAWHTQDDPLSRAVNRLSAETGALFVISAGNNGNDPYQITSPGTADAALTVGAVDSAGRLASFSSSGPRLLDDGLKPDLTAPGVDVLAARSQHLPWGEGYYYEQSGTSMAAPHVAGAAALLAQKHPAWKGPRIKDALMSTSVPTPHYSPYQAGTGRVDAAHAYTGDQIVATGSVDAGLVPWSRKGPRGTIRRQVTYTNTTGRPLTLDLALDRRDTPEGVFALAAGRVTVPAHGTASVPLAVDPRKLAPGQYAAQVVARFRGGTVHTAVGVAVEPEKHTLTVRLKDRAGRPVSGEVGITGADGVTHYLWAEDGVATGRWAPGTYTVVSYLNVEGTHGPHSLGFAVLTAPEVELTSDTTVDLDGSRLREAEVATPRPTSVTHRRIDVFRSFTSGEPTPEDRSALHSVLMLPPVYDSVWALPTRKKVTRGSFVFTTRFRAKQTPLRITYGRHTLDETLLVQPGSAPFAAGRTRLDAVYAGSGAPADYAGLSARGKAVVVRGDGGVPPAEQAAAAAAASAAALLVVTDGHGRGLDWYGAPDRETDGPLPVASVTADDGEELIRTLTAAGRKPVALTVEAHPSPEYLYDLADYHHGGIPADPSAATDPGHLARVDNTFAPPPGTRMVESREDHPAYEHFPAGFPYAVFGSIRVPAFPKEPVAPGHRTDWVSAGNGVKWQQYGRIDGWSTYTDITSYAPRSVRSERWFGPVVRPRMLSFEVPHRVGDGMGGQVAAFGDGGSAHSGDTGLMSRTFALYQGDRLLVRSGPRPDFGVGGLSPSRLPYRLVATTTNDGTVFPYSTTTHTEWTFTSGEAENEAVPLAQLDYDTETDLAGRAKRSSVLTVRPSVAGSDAPEDAVTSVALEVSYDDGGTWRRQSLKRTDGAWQARLHAPAGAEHVSLRVTAGQRNGGGVTQTVVRAFGLV